MITIGPKNMISLTYHEKQLEYNMKAMYKEIMRLYPEIQDVKNIDLNDPQYQSVIKSMAFNPILGGGLAKALGIQDKVLDLDLHRDIANGWARADLIPPGSPLHQWVEDTPRGLMVPFRRSASKMNEKGEYIIEYNKDGKQKPNRQGTEIVFTMGSNISATLARLAIDDPTVELKFRDASEKVFKKFIGEILKKNGMYRTGAGSTELNYVKEILYTAFLHTENRAELPFYHLHFDIQNVCLGYDDKLRSINTEKIVADIQEMKSEYMAQMKEVLENEFGFVLQKQFFAEDLKNEFLDDSERNIVSYDIADECIPENVRQFMKGRQNEIDEWLKVHGKNMTATEREFARLESRDEKTELSPGELKQAWKTNFEALGWTNEQAKSTLNFNQSRSGVRRLSDEQHMTNYQRYVQQKSNRDFNDFYDEYKKKKAYFDVRKIVSPALEKSLIDGFIRKIKEVDFSEEQFKAHMVIQLIDTHDTETSKRIAAHLFETQCVGMMHKSQKEYFADFLEGKVEDLFTRQQFQMRYAKEVRFTTKEILGKEQYISKTLKARENEIDFVFDRQEVVKFLLEWEDKKTALFREKNPEAKPFKFANGQRDAFISALTKPGAINIVSGRAGSGKSTMMEAIKDFYDTKGIIMFGSSTSATATNGLAEAVNLNISDYANCAKLIHMIHEGKSPITNKHVLTIDEAGFLDLDVIYEIVKHCNEKGARILLAGEASQLQNVMAGSSFRILSDQFGFTAVNEINRQREDWAREMVEGFACGRAGESMKTLFDRGHVTITKTDKERAEALVSDYLNTINQDGVIREEYYSDFGKKKFREKPNLTKYAFTKKIIIAATNLDVEMLNEMVRAQLKKEGVLKDDVVSNVVCKDGGIRNFTEGDRVVFTKATKTSDTDPLNIANSETGTVKSFIFNDKHEVAAMVIGMDNGKSATIKLGKKPPAIRHGFATTTHKSQGATKDDAFYMPSHHLNSLHQTYVACSRHRNNVKVYLSEEMADELAEKMEDKLPSPAMLGVAQSIAKKMGINLPSEDLESFNRIRGFLNDHYERFDDVGHKRHPLDDFTSIVEAMSQTAFKRSTFDFDILDGKQMNAYKDEFIRRRDMLDNPDKYAISQTQVEVSEMKVEFKPLKAKLDLSIEIDGGMIAQIQANKNDKVRSLSDIPTLIETKKEPQKQKAFVIETPIIIKKHQKPKELGLVR